MSWCYVRQKSNHIIFRRSACKKENLEFVFNFEKKEIILLWKSVVIKIENVYNEKRILRKNKNRRFILGI